MGMGRKRGEKEMRKRAVKRDYKKMQEMERKEQQEKGNEGEEGRKREERLVKGESKALNRDIEVHYILEGEE